MLGYPRTTSDYEQTRARSFHEVATARTSCGANANTGNVVCGRGHSQASALCEENTVASLSFAGQAKSVPRRSQTSRERRSEREGRRASHGVEVATLKIVSPRSACVPSLLDAVIMGPSNVTATTARTRGGKQARRPTHRTRSSPLSHPSKRDPQHGLVNAGHSSRAALRRAPTPTAACTGSQARRC